MKYNSALVVVLALLHPSHRRLMARDVLTFRFFFPFPSTSHYYSFVNTQQEKRFQLLNLTIFEPWP